MPRHAESREPFSRANTIWIAPRRATPPRASGFRADIQGLRAVAVGVVLLFHTGVPELSGGYVGVDVFFVISGFLITGQLIRELGATGRISFAGFYARRIRRLLPAAALVLAFTLVAAWYLFPPLVFGELARAGEATALYIPNIYFSDIGVKYLADATPSPLLHYWSLGVEEQFYLLWPLLMLTLSRLRSSARLTVALAAVAVISLLWCVWLTSRDGVPAFFMLPGRVWEFAAGAIVAVTANRFAKLPSAAAWCLGWLGLAAILVSACVYTDTTLFPGWAALLPTGGAAAIIVAGGTLGSGGVAAVLRTRPMQYFGRISYSLYLWHWPLLVLPAAYATPLTSVARAGLVGLAVVLADLTQRFVEEPIKRHQRLVAMPWTNYGLAAALAAATISLAFVIGRPATLDAGRPVAARPGSASALAVPPVTVVPSNLTPTLRGAIGSIPETYTDGCHADTGATVPLACVYGAKAARHSIVLLGDSHAAQWFPALKVLTTRRDWRLINFTASGCPAAIITVYSPLLRRVNRECDAWRSAAVRDISRLDPDAIVASSSRDYKLVGISGSSQSEPWRAGIDALFRQLPVTSAKFLIGDTPHFIVAPAYCLSKHVLHATSCTHARSAVEDRSFMTVERQAAVDSNAHYVDMNRFLCPHDRCQAIAWNILVYRDTNHITVPMSVALAGALGRAIRTDAPAPRRP